eukprot:jgi/Hompol1/2585/HPOL_001429-RA
MLPASPHQPQSLLPTGAAGSTGDGHQSPFQERRHPGITVQVVLSAKNGGRFKTLEVQLTDDTDPYFLFNLDISEDDFPVLRAQQNLLIDFAQFPLKFVELLEECIASTSEDHPKFLAHLATDSHSRYAAFSIIETNSFKHINHLSLQFVPGTDAAIKQYLATLVKQFKSENGMLKEQLAKTNTLLNANVSECQATISRLTSELEQSRSAHLSLETKLRLEHAAELSKQKEASALERESLRIQFEASRKDTDQQHEQKIRDLSQKLASVTTAHSLSVQHGHSLESSLSSATQKIETFTQELATLKYELDRASTKYQQADRSRADIEAALAASKERIIELERSNRLADETQHKLRESLAQLQEQRLFHTYSEVQSKAEEALDMHKTQNARFEESLKRATDEITKGNEIIRKLQTEIKNSRSKLKLKNVVTLQQEKLLDERAAAIETLQKELVVQKDAHSKKVEDYNALRDKSDELKMKLDEAKAIIEDNNRGNNTATAIDFEKYASISENFKSRQTQRRSPTVPTTTYRSRYVPQQDADDGSDSNLSTTFDSFHTYNGNGSRNSICNCLKTLDQKK